MHKFASDVQRLEIDASLENFQENFSKNVMQDGGNGNCAIFSGNEANCLC